MSQYENLLLKNISKNLKSKKAAEELKLKIEQEFDYEVSIGIEVEFYKLGDGEIFLKHSKEKGKNQFEINLGPYKDLDLLFKDIKILLRYLRKNKAIISPKPFPKDYGNALQFNVALMNPIKGFADKLILEKIAGALCHYTKKFSLVFLPYEKCYLRLDAKFLAPENFSFGYNNRTTLVRIPDSLPNRLEYRLGTPMSNYYLLVFCILKSAYLGLKEQKFYKEYGPIFGNSWEYDLNTLPKSIDEARKFFDIHFFD